MKFYFIKNFIDAVFLGFIFCFFSYILLNYFLLRALAIIFSVCIFSLSLIFFFARFQRKNQEMHLKTIRLSQIENLFFWLSTTKKEKILKEVLSTISSNGYMAKIKKGEIFLIEEKRYVFLAIPPDGLKKHHLVKAFNYLSVDETALLIDANKNEEIICYAKNFNDKILVSDASALFPYLNEDFISSLKTVNLKEKKPVFKNFLLKKRAKNFLVFGVIFMCLSFISPLKLYYVISGAIFIFLFFLSKIFGKE